MLLILLFQSKMKRYAYVIDVIGTYCIYYDTPVIVRDIVRIWIVNQEETKYDSMYLRTLSNYVVVQKKEIGLVLKERTFLVEHGSSLQEHGMENIFFYGE